MIRWTLSFLQEMQSNAGMPPLSNLYANQGDVVSHGNFILPAHEIPKLLYYNCVQVPDGP